MEYQSIKLPSFLQSREQLQLHLYFREMFRRSSCAVSEILDGRLAIFDHRYCTFQASLALREIITHALQLTKQRDIEPFYISTLLELLRPPSSFQDFEEASELLLEDATKIWTNETNPFSRIFYLLSILLIILDQPRPSQLSQNSRRYGAKEREYLRTLSHFMFEMPRETGMKEHNVCSEWNIVLLAEYTVSYILLKKTFRQDSSSEKAINEFDDYFFGNVFYKEIKVPYESKFFKKTVKNSNSNLKFAIPVIYSDEPPISAIAPSVPIGVRSFEFECLKDIPSLHSTLVISGWLSQDDTIAKNWSGLLSYPNQGRAFAFRWESSSLRRVIDEELYDLLKITMSFISNPIVNINSLYTLLRLHPYRRTATKAKLSGRYLAKILSQGLFGQTSITIVAYSLGTRVAYHCMQQLAKMDCNLVQDLYLIGGVAPMRLDRWREIKKAVSGRLVNVYSKEDKIVMYGFPVVTANSAIGSGPIPIDGVENYDVGHIVDGHFKYRHRLDEVLRYIRYNS